MIQILEFKEWLVENEKDDEYKNAVNVWNESMLYGIDQSKNAQEIAAMIRLIERGFVDYISEIIPEEVCSTEELVFDIFKYRYGYYYGHKIIPKTLIEL